MLEENVTQTILPKLKIGELRKVEDLLVLQATQDATSKENTPRGIFEVSIATIELTLESFTLLEHILQPISANTKEDLRPFVSDLFNRNELINSD